MTTSTALRFKVLGINQDRDFCECCGKTGINSVVWIEDTKTGIVKHFGQVCALKPVKGFDCSAEIKSAIKSVKNRLEMMLSRVSFIYKERGGKMMQIDAFSIGPADRDLYAQVKAEQTAKAYAAA